MTRIGYIALLILLLVRGQALAQECNSNCVWPGDLNENGIVNSLDILTQGLAFEQNGPARANMSIEWQSLNASDWPQPLVLGANLKHADANGDGLIDELDQQAVSQNYGLTNDDFNGLLGNELPGEQLSLLPSAGSISPGSSLFVDIHLGDEEAPVNNLYGIAFEIDIDTQYVEAVLFDFTESWIGTTDQRISFGKFNDDRAKIGIAISRIDSTTVSGSGIIGRMEIIITDVILGLEADTTACLPLPLTIRNVLGMGLDESDLLITSQSPPDVMLKHPSQLTSTSVSTSAVASSISIYPNPTDDHIWINTLGRPIKTVELYDIRGQRVLHQPTDHMVAAAIISLNLNRLPPGPYLLLVRDDISVHRRRMIVR
ncbi:MAG: T9SS type A sorting domain-containing protein [Bacteroidota bacterium]